jgi:hypothetical protein
LNGRKKIIVNEEIINRFFDLSYSIPEKVKNEIIEIAFEEYILRSGVLSSESWVTGKNYYYNRDRIDALFNLYSNLESISTNESIIQMYSVIGQGIFKEFDSKKMKKIQINFDASKSDTEICLNNMVKSQYNLEEFSVKFKDTYAFSITNEDNVIDLASFLPQIIENKKLEYLSLISYDYPMPVYFFDTLEKFGNLKYLELGLLERFKTNDIGERKKVFENFQYLKKKLETLIIIFIDKNQFDYIIENISYMNQLKKFAIRYKRKRDYIIGFDIVKLPIQLEFLEISNIDISQNNLKTISLHFPYLKTLVLKDIYSNITDKNFEDFSNNKSLSEIQIDGLISITPNIIPTMCQIRNLKILNIKNIKSINADNIYLKKIFYQRCHLKIYINDFDMDLYLAKTTMDLKFILTTRLRSNWHSFFGY